jgi:hypothetical protein
MLSHRLIDIKDQSQDVSPALRLLTSRARVVTQRPIVVAGGLLARLGVIDGISVWRDLARPHLALAPGRPSEAAWVRRTLLPDQRSEGVIPAAVWQAGRAGGLLVGGDCGLAVGAAEHALGRALVDPAAVLLSPAGCANKATAFVFERDRVTPSAVVKTMADARREAWLRGEIELTAALRSSLDGDRVASALSAPPLFAGRFGDDYVVVESFDPVSTGTGRAGRDVSIAWLTAFRRATATGYAPWSPADVEGLIATVERSWERIRPGAQAGVVADLGERMQPLMGLPVLRCAVHGDFGSGNIARRESELRVLDWEWGALSGDPFLDLWTYELGELRGQLALGTVDARAELDKAERRVARQLSEEGMDPRFSLATLAPCAGQLVTRIRDVSDSPSAWEDGGDELLRGVEELILDANAASAGPGATHNRITRGRRPASSVPHVPAEGSHVVRVQQRSPAVVALRRMLRRIPGAVPAYRAAARARMELRMAYHAVRARIVGRLVRTSELTSFSGQAPRKAAAASRKSAGLRELLRDAGVMFTDRDDRLCLRRDEPLVEALGEPWGLYPVGAEVRLVLASRSDAVGSAGHRERLHESLLAANIAHLHGAGPRPYDALEVSVGAERWLALVSAPDGATESQRKLDALLQRGELTTVHERVDGLPPWDRLRVTTPEDFVRLQVDKEAQRDLHFGREAALQSRYLYQSVPTLGARGRRDSAKRWALISALLAEAGIEMRERLVCDVGCNAGMMLGAALGEGAAWGLGWDLPPVVERAQSLMLALGYTRFNLFGAELTEDYSLREDVPPHLRSRLEGSVMLYLAVRHHVGFLRELGEIQWSALVYEGGETESTEHLDESLRDLRELCDFSVVSARDFRDSETGSRPVAVLVRR